MTDFITQPIEWCKKNKGEYLVELSIVIAFFLFGFVFLLLGLLSNWLQTLIFCLILGILSSVLYRIDRPKSNVIRRASVTLKASASVTHP
ncbi:MAG: hypothetical protein ACP5I1_16885, partial [Candidatus Hinthialibacter sp.]